MNANTMTTQCHQKAVELRTLAAFMLRAAAEYERLAVSFNMPGDAQRATSTETPART